MKRVFIIPFILAGLAFAYAQKWEVDSDFGLFFSQSAYGSNWAGEGVGNISWTGKFYASAETQLMSWLGYRGVRSAHFGHTHRQYRDEAGQLRWAKPEKIADRSDWEHMLKLTINKKWVDPFFMARKEDMFVDDDVECYMDHDHFVQALIGWGLGREMINTPNTKLNLYLTRTLRFKDEWLKLVIQFPDWWGGGHRIDLDLIKWDEGVELAAEYKQRFDKINGKLRSDLKLYQVTDKAPDLLWATRGYQPLEVNWETDFSVKLWKCIIANFNFALKYDLEDTDALQWRQMLGLGIGYSLP